jgi:Fe-S oxidoreductase
LTTTYDPKHPQYLDQGDVRDEQHRVYDLCHGCRLCWNLCPSFNSLFDIIDESHDGQVDAMTSAEQDRIVDECYQCKLCYVKCPYVPPHEWALDFPRLMLRAVAARHGGGSGDLTDQFLGQTDLIGKVSTVGAPVLNRVTGSPGSLARKVMQRATGIHADRLLPPYARQRFSTWWNKRGKAKVRAEDAREQVALFPTCLVEYQDPSIGRDLVHVYERNGIACDVPEGTVCCGMPWLDGGDVRSFTKQAEQNVAVLADAVRAGNDVVVPQPTCGYVLKRDYPEYVGNDDSRLVAEATYDAAEYLMKVHKDRGLDTDFPGDVPGRVTWHAPCHLRAQRIGYKSRDLMQLTGAHVTVVDECSGIDGTWGYRAEHYELARKVAQPMARAIQKDGAEVVAGDCHLANGSILQETGRTAVHPVQVLARAYGIPEDDGGGS